MLQTVYVLGDGYGWFLKLE